MHMQSPKKGKKAHQKSFGMREILLEALLVRVTHHATHTNTHLPVVKPDNRTHTYRAVQWVSSGYSESKRFGRKELLKILRKYEKEIDLNYNRMGVLCYVCVWVSSHLEVSANSFRVSPRPNSFHHHKAELDEIRLLAKKLRVGRKRRNITAL